MEEFIINLLKTGLGGFISAFLFVMIFFMPRWLWRRAKDKKSKKSIPEKSGSEGLTPFEYALKNTPTEYIKICEFYRENSIEIKLYLDTLLKTKSISKECYTILLKEYSKPMSEEQKAEVQRAMKSAQNEDSSQIEEIEKTISKKRILPDADEKVQPSQQNTKKERACSEEQVQESNGIVKEENSKMYCQHCGKELSQYADVCLNCGAFVSEIVKKKNVSKTDPSSPVYNVINIAVFVLSIIESLILSIFSAIEETFFIYSDIYYTRKGNEAHLGHSYIDFRYTAMFVSSIVVISTLLLVSLILYGKTKNKLAAASIFITLGAIIVSMIFTFITVAAY